MLSLSRVYVALMDTHYLKSHVQIWLQSHRFRSEILAVPWKMKIARLKHQDTTSQRNKENTTKGLRTPPNTFLLGGRSKAVMHCSECFRSVRTLKLSVFL